MRGVSLLGAAVGLIVAGSSAVGAQQAVFPSSQAHYEIRHGKSLERLDVVRTEQRVEHHYRERGVIEVWQRDARGELEHWKHFPALQRSVHYAPGDLRTIHVAPSWEQLATLIDPAERARLKASGAKRVAGRLVALLRGTIEGQAARVSWSEALGWAAEIVLGSGAEQTRYRLDSTAPCAASACPRFDASSYREIEFADLGDSENDPFVRRFLASFAGRAH